MLVLTTAKCWKTLFFLYYAFFFFFNWTGIIAVAVRGGEKQGTLTLK